MESLNCEDLYQYVNLTGFRKRTGSKAMRFLSFAVKPFLSQKLKKLSGRSTITAHTDHFKIGQINPQWMEDIERQLRKARAQADYLVVLLHSGGQFNIEPGEYSKYIMERILEFGADIVIGNHPHTVQHIEKRNGKIAAYSLGGYCMSVSGEYLVHDCLPEYSLALHVDLDQTNRISCEVTVLKGTEDESGYLSVRKATDQTSDLILQRCAI